MVNFKRKVNSEKDIYIHDGFDSVIETIDEPPKRKVYRPSSYTEGRSFADTYTQNDQSLSDLSYTPMPRQKANQDINYRSNYPKAHEGRQARLHDIRKASPQKEQALEVTSRTKFMLVTYLIAAVILATVVIVTGVMLANANDNASALEQQLASQTQVLNQQDIQLTMLNDDTFIRGMALEMGMEINDDIQYVDLIAFVAPIEITPSTNWFDRFTRFFARIFTR
ncbi:MAG: hypothetical protein FWE03_01120 [Firmicutes bacterium]|nr:hypothetical protein [Bacillota bacterium]